MDQNSHQMDEFKELLHLDNSSNSQHSKKIMKRSLNTQQQNSPRILLGLGKSLKEFEKIEVQFWDKYKMNIKTDRVPLYICKKLYIFIGELHGVKIKFHE